MHAANTKASSERRDVLARLKISELKGLLRVRQVCEQWLNDADDDTDEKTVLVGKVHELERKQLPQHARASSDTGIHNYGTNKARAASWRHILDIHCVSSWPDWRCICAWSLRRSRGSLQSKGAFEWKTRPSCGEL